MGRKPRKPYGTTQPINWENPLWGGPFRAVLPEPTTGKRRSAIGELEGAPKKERDSLGKQLCCLIGGAALNVSAATFARSYYPGQHDPAWDELGDQLVREVLEGATGSLVDKMQRKTRRPIGFAVNEADEQPGDVSELPAPAKG